MQEIGKVERGDISVGQARVLGEPFLDVKSLEFGFEVNFERGKIILDCYIVT